MIISPSPPPPISQSQMQGTDAADPRIASLKAIFPDFDDAVIHSVLESTNYDHDRALDVLLGMNDPSFVPPVPPPSSQPPNQFFQSTPSSDTQRISQEALDEEFARRLALEEQQGAAQPWQPQDPQGQTAYPAYQPRRGGWGSPPQGRPQSQGQGNYSMAEFQDGFNRIAESGKKTFSSIVSKVKAKMQEFDQGQGWSGSQNPAPGNQPPQSGSTQYYPSYGPGQQQNFAQGAYAQHYPSTQPRTNSSYPRTSTYQTSPPRSGVLRPAAAETAQASATSQQPSYYDPNTRGYDLYGDDHEEDIQIIDNTTPSARAASTPSIDTAPKPATPSHAGGPASQGSTPPPSFVTSPPPSYASPSPISTVSPNLSLSASPPPARSLTGTPTTVGGRSTTPGAPGGVDFSKLGLLPKRPISLVQPQSLPVAGAGVGAPRVATAHSVSTAASSTDGEEEREPEFVENPFEDPR